MSILQRVVFFILLGSFGWAYEISDEEIGSPILPTPEVAPSPAEKKSPGLWKETLGSAKEFREFTHYGVLGNFTFFEMWVLTKYGFTLEYVHDPAWTWELEYMRGSLNFGFFGLNIGKIQEQRLSLLVRSFGRRNSLNFLMGVFHGTFDIHLGSNLLNSVPGVPASQIDLVRTQAGGVTWGIGNRWQTKQGYIFGVDWLVIQLPLAHFGQKSAFLDASNDTVYEDQVRNALNLLNKVPAVGLLKVQVGMSF